MDIGTDFKDMTAMLYIKHDNVNKRVWWKKVRHGTIVCVKDFVNGQTTVSFLENFRPIKIEEVFGKAVSYDLVSQFESFN